MTMTTTNVEILRQGWLDAASALAPGLDALPEFLEHGLEAAVIDERLDEQSLLRVVTEVTSAAADSLPAEELYFLTRRLQRAVYEYLLSLDALPEPPPRRDASNGHPAPDTALIGAEEVAALGRNGHVKTVVEPHLLKATPVPELEPEPTPEALPDVVPETNAEALPETSAETAAADRVEAGLAELDAQLSPDEVDDAPVAAAEPENETASPEAPDHGVEPSTRPAFTLFRRNGTASKADKSAQANGTENVGAEPAAANGSGTAHADENGDDAESFVKPKSGFHLSDLADFAVVQRSAVAPEAPQESEQSSSKSPSRSPGRNLDRSPSRSPTPPRFSNAWMPSNLSRPRSSPRPNPLGKRSPRRRRAKPRAAPRREAGGSATTTRIRMT